MMRDIPYEDQIFVIGIITGIVLTFAFVGVIFMFVYLPLLWNLFPVSAVGIIIFVLCESFGFVFW